MENEIIEAIKTMEIAVAFFITIQNVVIVVCTAVIVHFVKK